MAEQGWNDNRINEYVERNAERSNQMWTETLRFMRDSYEARMENENKKLRDALEMIAADIDEMNALSMGDTTVSLKEVVRLGKVAHKALAEKEITR